MEEIIKTFGAAIAGTNISSKSSPLVSVLDALSYEYGIKCNVVPCIQSLPTELQRWASSKSYDKGLLGVYDSHNGSVWLVSDNLNGPHDAALAYLHEIVGHHGVRGLLKDDHGKIMHDIYDSMRLSPVATRIRDVYNLNVDHQENRIALAEEFVSHLAETGKRPTVFNRLMLAVKEKLSSVTGRSVSYTENDIHVLLQRARNSLNNLKRDKSVEWDYVPTPKALVLNSLFQAEKDVKTNIRFEDWLVAESARVSLPPEMFIHRDNVLKLFNSYLVRIHSIKVQNDGTIDMNKPTNDKLKLLAGHNVRCFVNSHKSSIPAGSELTFSTIWNESFNELTELSIPVTSLNFDNDTPVLSHDCERPEFNSAATTGRFHALYVGETSNLSEEMSDTFDCAVAMHAKGEPMQAIWERTGWQDFAGLGWAYEVDDSRALTGRDIRAEYEAVKARCNGISDLIKKRGVSEDLLASLKEYQVELNSLELFQNYSEPGTLSAYLYHPELYKHYPDASSIKVSVRDDLGVGVDGFYSQRNDEIVIRDGLSGNELKAVLLHEAQHLIQNREKWRRDTSFSADNELQEISNKLSELESKSVFRSEYHEYVVALGAIGEQFAGHEDSEEYVHACREVRSNWNKSLLGSEHLLLLKQLQTLQQASYAAIASPEESMSYDVAARMNLSPQQRTRIQPLSTSVPYVDLPTLASTDESMQFMFAGRGSIGIDSEKMRTAQALRMAGADTNIIMRETGLFFSYDEKIRDEFSDHNATVDSFTLSLVSQNANNNEELISIESIRLATKPGGNFDAFLFRGIGQEPIVLTELPRHKIAEVLSVDIENAVFSGDIKPNATFRLPTPLLYKTSATTALDKLLIHDELYKRYPQTREWNVTVVPIGDLGLGVQGECHPAQKAITVIDTDADEMRRILLHEVQHAIQVIEGHAVGGSPDSLEQREGANLLSLWLSSTKVRDDLGGPRRVFLAIEGGDSQLLTSSGSVNEFSGTGMTAGYVAINNPFYATRHEILRIQESPAWIDELKAQGYDGVVSVKHSTKTDDSDLFLTFEPHQFKRENDINLENQSSPFYSALLKFSLDTNKALSAKDWLAELDNQVQVGSVTAQELKWSGLQSWLNEHNQADRHIESMELSGFIQANMLELAELVSSDTVTPILSRLLEQDSWQLVAGDEWVSKHIPLIHLKFDDPHWKVSIDSDKSIELSSDLIRHNAIIAGMKEAEKYARLYKGLEIVNPELRLPGESVDHKKIALVVPAEFDGTYKNKSKSRDPVVGYAFIDTRIDSRGSKVLLINDIATKWQSSIDVSTKDNSLPRTYLHNHRNGKYSAQRLDGDGQYQLIKEFTSSVAAREAIPQLNADLGLGEKNKWPVKTVTPNTGHGPNPAENGWPEMLMKRLIRHAIESGHDRVEWVSAADQHEHMPSSTAAATILDVRLPAAMNSYLSPWGVSVDTGTVGTGMGFDISAEMREGIALTGQPMFRVSVDANTESKVKIQMDERISSWLPAADSADAYRAKLKGTILSSEVQSFDIYSGLRSRVEECPDKELSRTDMLEWGGLTAVERLAILQLPAYASATDMLNNIDVLAGTGGNKSVNFAYSDIDEWLGSQGDSSISRQAIIDHVSESATFNELVIGGDHLQLGIEREGAKNLVCCAALDKVIGAEGQQILRINTIDVDDTEACIVAPNFDAHLLAIRRITAYAATEGYDEIEFTASDKRLSESLSRHNEFLADNNVPAESTDNRLSVKISGALREIHSINAPKMASYRSQGAPTLGFQSTFESVISAQLPKSAPANVYLQMLDGMAFKGKFKRSEYEWTGVDAWLSDKGGASVTKDGLLEFVRDNSVTLTEQIQLEPRNGWMRTDGAPDIERISTETINNDYGECVLRRYLPANSMDDTQFTILEVNGSFINQDTGEAYEALAGAEDALRRDLSVAAISAANNAGGGPRYTSRVQGGPIGMYAELLVSIENSNDDDTFITRHWPGLENVIAHARLSERYGKAGEKVLFVEEIQSDWLQLEHAGSDVPDAPFGGQWPTLIMKRVIDFAVKNGYDSVSWTNIKDQFAYETPFEPVQKVEVVNIGMNDKLEPIFMIYDKSKPDEAPLFKEPLNEDQLRKNITGPGTDYLFDVIMPTLNIEKQSSDFEGVLYLGGTGLTSLYEDVLPNQMQKYLKRYECKVADIELEGMEETGPRKGFVITESLRQIVQAGAQPMFRLGEKEFSIVGLAPHAPTTGLVRTASPNINDAPISDAEVRRRGKIEVAEKEPVAASNNIYARLEGEREAFMTEASADLNEEQRKQRDPLALPIGVSKDQLIISFFNSGPMAMFAGDVAITADSESLKKAHAMEASGRFTHTDAKDMSVLTRKPAALRTPKEIARLVHLHVKEASSESLDVRIYKETGWVKGRDNQFKFEIPDKGAKLLARVEELRHDDFDKLTASKPHIPAETVSHTLQARLITQKSYPIASIIDHPALFDAYPQLALLKVRDVPAKDGASASIDMDAGVISYNKTMCTSKLLPALLVQLQHAVQCINDFAVGGAVSQFREPTAAYTERYAQVLEAQAIKRELAACRDNIHDLNSFLRENDISQPVANLVQSMGLDEINVLARQLCKGALTTEQVKLAGDHEVRAMLTRYKYGESHNVCELIRSGGDLVLDFNGAPSAFLKRMDASLYDGEKITPDIQAACTAALRARNQQEVRSSLGLASSVGISESVGRSHG